MYKLLLTLTLLFSINSTSQNLQKIGTKAPNFKLWMLDGTKLTNADISGKVVVFKFWFTTCMPCLTSMPKLNKLVEEFKETKDVLFIAPALDRKVVINKLLAVHPFNFKIGYSAIDVSRKFNLKQVYPSYFIVDRNGDFSYIDSGGTKSDIKKLKAAILSALEM